MAPSGTARQIARHCAELRTIFAKATRALPEPARRSIAAAPIFQVQWSLDTMKDDKRGLVHERSCEAAAACGDASASVGLSDW
jgi:hypothetical protein